MNVSKLEPPILNFRLLLKDISAFVKKKLFDRVLENGFLNLRFPFLDDHHQLGTWLHKGSFGTYLNEEVIITELVNIIKNYYFTDIHIFLDYYLLLIHSFEVLSTAEDSGIGFQSILAIISAHYLKIAYISNFLERFLKSYTLMKIHRNRALSPSKFVPHVFILSS